MRALFRAALIFICAPFVTLALYTIVAFDALLLAPSPDEPAEGIAIYACDNGVHTDLVIPVTFAGFDLRTMFWERAFTGPTASYDHVGIGWGSRDFYINTPTWAEFDIVTAAKSMLWDETVLHVEYRPRPVAGENCRQWRADQAAQERIMYFIWESLRRSGLLPVQAAPGYGDRDTFYVANGRYTIIETCNQRTGQALRLGGAPVAPWTPFSFLVLWHLPAISP